MAYFFNFLNRLYGDCTIFKSTILCEGFFDAYITAIGDDVFKGLTTLTSVTIPEGVTSIGLQAFYGCTKLTSATIPSGVTVIKQSAFRDCTALELLDIPEGVEEIGIFAFKGCKSLTSVIIPEGVTSIGRAAFEECTNLSTVTLADSVTSIGSSAFFNCRSLVSINIPVGVTSLDDLVFCGCRSLVSIDIPNTVTKIGSGAFNSCSNLGSISIPEGVTNIGEQAFRSCTSLVSLIIPNNVTSISFYTFADCTNLTSITIPSSVTAIQFNSFEGCGNVTIYGYTGSYAQEYAKLRKVPFVALDQVITFDVTPVDATVEVQDSAGEEVMPEIDGTYLLEAGGYSYTVTRDGYKPATGTFAVTDQAKTVTVVLEELLVPTTVAISGPDAVQVKLSGDATATYTATVQDQHGNAMPAETVTWSLKEAVEGVSVAADTGVVTVADTTVAESFIIVATSATDAKVKAEKTVTLTKEKSNDATLNDLTVDGTTVAGFAADKLAYNVELAAGTTKVPTVAATATDSHATIDITQAAALDDTNNVATVKVTAEDGTTTKIYTITFTVVPNQDQDAPEGLTGVAPTSQENNDGKITGVTDAMEYKLSTDTEWTAVPAAATEITGLAAGTYQVRYAAKPGYNAGTAAEVVVPEYVVPKYAVTFSAGENGTLAATVDDVAINTGAEIEEGKTVVFTATPNEGYRVKGWTLNDEAVADNTTNTFTVENLTAAIEVTVEFELIPPTTYILTLTGEGLASTPEAGGIDENTEVTITVTPPEGKQVATFTVGGTDKKAELVDGKYIFTITEDTEVVVTYEDIPPATYTVAFAVTPADVAIVVKDSDSNIVTPEEDGTYVLEAGEYSYTVTRDGYKPAAGTFTVTDQAKTVTVMLEEIGTIISVEPVEDIAVEFGTSKAAALAALAETTTILDSKGVSHEVTLSWTIDSYNGNAAGEYTATGTFELPAGVDQSDPAVELKVSATVTVKEKVVEEGKAALQKAINEALALAAEDYTPHSWKALSNTLRNAQVIFNLEHIAQPAVDQALARLTTASAQLVEKPDKSTLEAAINTAQALSPADYTARSWRQASNALTVAVRVFQNENATQADVDQAAVRLNNALSALVKS